MDVEEYRKRLNYIARNISRANWEWIKDDRITFLNKIVYTEDNWGWFMGFIAINMEGNVLVSFAYGKGLDAPKWNEGEVPTRYVYRSRKVNVIELEKILTCHEFDLTELESKIDKVYNQIKADKEYKGIRYIPTC